MPAYSLGDTLVALSSPPGHALAGLIRLSGPNAFALARGRFVPSDDKGIPNWTAQRGSRRGLLDWRTGDDAIPSGAEVPAVAWIFPAPASYTREDVVEFHVPGSPALLRSLLEAFVEDGARPAAPGEFTARALMLGRINLRQAAAIADLVRATGEIQRQAALAALSAQRGGPDACHRQPAANAFNDGMGMPDDARRWHQSLMELLAWLERDMLGDEPDGLAEKTGLDSQIPHGQMAFFRGQLTRLRHDAECFHQACDQSLRPGEGVRVRLGGKVNAGKSSLYNALLGFDSGAGALISVVPGATRDILATAVAWDGVAMLLEDGPGMDDRVDERMDGAVDERMDGAVEGMDTLRAAASRRWNAWHDVDILLWCVAADDASFESGGEKLPLFDGSVLLVRTKSDKASIALDSLPGDFLTSSRENWARPVESAATPCGAGIPRRADGNAAEAEAPPEYPDDSAGHDEYGPQNGHEGADGMAPLRRRLAEMAASMTPARRLDFMVWKRCRQAMADAEEAWDGGLGHDIIAECLRLA